MEISADLVGWAELAGYSYAREGDAILLYSSGGETCYYIRRDHDRDPWIIVTESDRGGGEEFVVAAASQAILEKYFWNDFGFDIRMARRQPRLVFPTKPEELPSGYLIEELNDRLVLTDSRGALIARGRNSSTGRSLLVELAAIVGYSAQELKESYLNPDGKPIFPR